MTTIDQTRYQTLAERRLDSPVFAETRRGVETAGASAADAAAVSAAERAKAWRAVLAGDLL